MAQQGFKVKASSNVDKVLGDLDRWQGAAAVALPVALNKLGEQGRVAGMRAIRKRYGLTIADLAPYFDVVPTGQGGPLVFKIEAKGKGFPLRIFKPREVRGAGGGVSVLLVGRRVLFRHAFFMEASATTRQSRRKGPRRLGPNKERLGHIFARGRYGGKSGFEGTGETFGRFRYGRQRFPITLLRSTTPPSILLNPEIEGVIVDRINEQAPAILRNAFRFARGR